MNLLNKIFECGQTKYCRYEFKNHPNHCKLRLLGIIADKLYLLDTDIVTNEPYFTFIFWIDFVICLFKGHDYQWHFRTPRGTERGDPNLLGLVRMSGRSCSRCGSPEFGIETI